MSGHLSQARDDAGVGLESGMSGEPADALQAAMPKVSVGEKLRNAVRKLRALSAGTAGAAAGEDRGSGEIGIAAAVGTLTEAGVKRAIVLSPEGDEAVATAVLMARALADSGLKVMLLDLTCSGAASMPMLESRRHPGITNLLCGEVRLSGAIHRDLYSDCHLIPAGTADAARAMRAADRLPLILDTLDTAYDIVIVECGPAPPSTIGMFEKERMQIVLSAIGADNGAVSEAEAALRESGHGDLMRVTPVGHPPEAGEEAFTDARRAAR